MRKSFRRGSSSSSSSVFARSVQTRRKKPHREGSSNNPATSITRINRFQSLSIFASYISNVALIDFYYDVTGTTFTKSIIHRKIRKWSRSKVNQLKIFKWFRRNQLNNRPLVMPTTYMAKTTFLNRNCDVINLCMIGEICGRIL